MIIESLTTLLSHCHHGVVADQAGNKWQGTGPQVLDYSRHESACQSLLESPAGRRVLGFISVGDDDVGDPLLNEANV